MIDEKALFALTHGVYVIGAKDEAQNRYVGSAVDAIMQVAHKPFVVALSCGNHTYTKETIQKTGMFAISILPQDVDPFIIANFGFQSSRDVNKWDNVEYEEKDNLPYLKNVLGKIRCKVLEQVAYDSNTLFLAEVLDAELGDNSGKALTYNDYRGYFKNEVIKVFNEQKQRMKGK